MSFITPPSSIIDPTLAGQRRDYFLKTKKPILDGLIGYKQEIDKLTYSVPVFLELLHFLTEEPGRFSGLRVYFASHLWSENDPCSRFIPSGQEENLTLIFLPTKAETLNGTTIQRDDLDNCFIISHNRLIRLPKPGTVAPDMDTASNWVEHYQKKLPALSLDGGRVTRNGAFRDTNCQWYKIEIFQDGENGPGLITYIKTLRDDLVNPVVAIEPLFACYTDTDTFKNETTGNSSPLQYQLTLLFQLRQKTDPAQHPVFGMKHHVDDLARAAAKKTVEAGVPQAGAPPGAVAEAAPESPAGGGMAQPEDADTGYPCPPANTCNGSLLP